MEATKKSLAPRSEKLERGSVDSLYILTAIFNLVRYELSRLFS